MFRLSFFTTEDTEFLHEGTKREELEVRSYKLEVTSLKLRV